MDRTENLHESSLITAIDDLIKNVHETFKQLVLPQKLSIIEPINNLLERWFDFTKRVFEDQNKLVNAQLSYWQDYLLLCKELQWKLSNNATLINTKLPNYFAQYEEDKNRILFNFIEKFHFLISQHILLTIKDLFTIEGADEIKKIQFYHQYLATAFSLTDFFNAYPDIFHINAPAHNEIVG